MIEIVLLLSALIIVEFRTFTLETAILLLQVTKAERFTDILHFHQ